MLCKKTAPYPSVKSPVRLLHYGIFIALPNPVFHFRWRVGERVCDGICTDDSKRHKKQPIFRGCLCTEFSALSSLLRGIAYMFCPNGALSPAFSTMAAWIASTYFPIFHGVWGTGPPYRDSPLHPGSPPCVHIRGDAYAPSLERRHNSPSSIRFTRCIPLYCRTC